VARVPPAQLLRLVGLGEEALGLLGAHGAVPLAIHHEQRTPVEAAHGAQRVRHRPDELGERGPVGQIPAGGEHQCTHDRLACRDDDAEERAERVADEREPPAVDLWARREVT
jgi:hypothetical protein